jgi:hypothetical protein
MQNLPKIDSSNSPLSKQKAIAETKKIDDSNVTLG